MSLVTQLDVKGLFVLLKHRGSSLGELLSESLHLRLFDSVEDDDTVDLVQRGSELVRVDHSRDDRSDSANGKVECRSEVRKGKRIVVRSVGEKGCSKTFFLDLLSKNVFNLGSVVQQVPNLDGNNQVPSFLPLASLQGLARLDNVVTSVLRRTHEGLSVGHIQQSLEGLASHSPSLLLSVNASKQRDLNKHARSEVRSFEKLNVEVHVEGQKSSLFEEFLLGRKLDVVPLHTLGKQLLLSHGREHLGQNSLAFGDKAESESSETELHNRTVVKNLSSDVGVGNGVLEVRHEEKVTSLVVSAVESLVKDVIKDSSGTKDGGIGLIDEHGEVVDDTAGVTLDVEGSDLGFQTSSGLGSLALKVLDDDVGLGVNVFETSDDGTGNVVGKMFTLKEGLSLDNSGVKRSLVLESVNVLVTLLMSISVLQSLGELEERMSVCHLAIEQKIRTSLSKLSKRLIKLPAINTFCFLPSTTSGALSTKSSYSPTISCTK